MKANNINQIANHQTMTSLQIAEILGRQHGVLPLIERNQNKEGGASC